MDSTSDELWTDADDNAAYSQGWMLYDNAGATPLMIVNASSSAICDGEDPTDIKARADVMRGAQEEDPLCLKAIAYVAFKRLTS